MGCNPLRAVYELLTQWATASLLLIKAQFQNIYCHAYSVSCWQLSQLRLHFLKIFVIINQTKFINKELK